MTEEKEKVFRCPACGSEQISEFAKATVITQLRVKWNKEKGEMIQTEEIDKDSHIDDMPCEYACADCSEEITWEQIKEALTPKQNQTTLV